MSSALIVRHLLNRCEHIFHVATHGRALFAFKLCCRGSLSHLTAPSYPKWANDNIWRLTERKSSEDKEKDRTNPPPHTHTHTCMYKYMGKTRPRPLNDKALPVWNNAHITTHHHHSAKRKFSVAPILSSRSCSEQKRNPLVRITFRQTRYYTAWLLRQHYAETGGRYDTSFHSEQTVEKHKQCLWFKAEANRKAECFVF